MSDGAVLLPSVLAAAVPTLFFIALIYWADRYEKEPWWLLTAAFLWGAVPGVVLALIFNNLLSAPIYFFASAERADALIATLVAPPVEETVKGLALVGILFYWRHEIDSPLDGIIYGAMVGMGFALVENVAYFVNVFAAEGAESWGLTIVVRALVFGLNHALFTSLTGLGLALGRFAVRPALRITAPIAGWLAAVTLHFLHNATVASGNLLCYLALLFDWGGVLLIVGIMIWALVQERRWIEKYLIEEVALGTLTPAQYRRTQSRQQRARHRLKMLLNGDIPAYLRARRFYHRCSELAYKKHHLTLFADKPTQQMIEALRSEIITLGRDVY